MTAKRMMAACLAAVVLSSALAWGQGATPPAAPKADPNTATAMLMVSHDSRGRGTNFADTPEAITVLLTRGRIPRKLYNEMQIYKQGPNAHEEFLAYLANNLRIEILSHSDRMTMVRLSLKSDDPAKAADILNRTLDAFKEVVEEYRTTRVDRATRVLAERAQDVERRLAEFMRSLQALEQERAALLVDDPGTIRARYQQILADIETYRRREAAAKVLIAKLEPLKKSPGVELEIARAQAEQETAAAELEGLEKRRAAELEAAKTFAQDLHRRDQLQNQLDALTAVRNDIQRAAEQIKTDFEMGEVGIEVLQKAELPAAPAR